MKPGNKIDRAEYLLWLGSCFYLSMCLQLPYEIKNETLMSGGKKNPESRKLLLTTLHTHWLYAVVLARGNVNVQGKEMNI